MSHPKSEANSLGQAYLDTLGRSVRKERGAYYTPPELARAICAAASTLVAQRAQFLDPACGAGAFLGAAAGLGFDRLCGVDCDAGAIAVAQEALRGARGLALAVGDALAGLDFRATFPDAFTRGGFDLVATNPPYVRADRSQEVLAVRRKLAASGDFRSLRHRWDLSAAFVERGVGLLRPGGIAVFLLPASYLRARYGRAQHDWLRREHEILEVRELPGSWFEAADVASAILLVRAGRGGGPVPGSGGPLPGRPVSLPGRHAPSPPPGTERLGDLCHISYGLRANSDERRWPGEFVTADVVRDAPDPTHPRKYTEGKDLGGFRVLRTRYLEWGTERAPSRFARRSRDAFLEAAPKILALCISGERASAALDTDGHAFNHTVVGILPHAGCPFDIRYLLAVLHARQTRDFLAAIRRSARHIYPDDWREVRVPRCPAAAQAEIAAAVDRARGVPFPSGAFRAEAAALQRLLDRAFETGSAR